MPARRLAGAAVRRLAPRTVQALETVPVLAEEVRALHAELTELRRRTEEVRAEVQRGAGRVDGLDQALAELDSDLAESRRLSLRVAQVTDLVFERLLATPERAESS
ncbi:DUF6752 domain-containing protein [Geodermatophilus sp. TF02-6]|uniref:DUF6752 domain-containing protein n=1 Tax=Geodermatophilus sp. TF02-6 TaxID=2250575 RepID=UPI0011BDBFEF|nr:DUF6752 domain-containing protein [Geodermatophilus sp. TF02-6]